MPGADLRWLTKNLKLDRELRRLEERERKGEVRQWEIDAFNRKVESHNRSVEKHNKKELARLERERKGGCFISTAVMTALDKDDRCSELSVLRQFRDDFLLSSLEGQILVDDYYAVAPRLLGKLSIQARGDESVYRTIYEEFLAPVIERIEQEDYYDAVVIYKQMVHWLEKL